MFRLVVRLYPAAHRAEHADEILGTVSDSLESQGRLGALRELADLTVHALRERTRLTATSPVGAVAAAAAPLAAGSAVALSLVFLAFAEWPGQGFGPFATLGAIPYLAWLLVFLAAVMNRAAAARRLAGVAVAAAVALVPLAQLTHLDRPRLPMLGSLVLFGLIVPAAPADPLERSPLDRRALSAGTLVMAGILCGIRLEYGPLSYSGNDTIEAMGALLPVALGCLFVLSLLCLRLDRRLPFAVAVVALPWAVFCLGTPGRPSPVFVGIAGAAALASVFPLLRTIDTDHPRRAVRGRPEPGRPRTGQGSS